MTGCQQGLGCQEISAGSECAVISPEAVAAPQPTTTPTSQGQQSHLYLLFINNVNHQNH